MSIDTNSIGCHISRRQMRLSLLLSPTRRVPRPQIRRRLRRMHSPPLPLPSPQTHNPPSPSRLALPSHSSGTSSTGPPAAHTPPCSPSTPTTATSSASLHDLSFAIASSYKITYGYASKGHRPFLKSGSYIQDTAPSMLTKRDLEKHAVMRRDLAPAFSAKAMREQEGVVVRYV